MAQSHYILTLRVILMKDINILYRILHTKHNNISVPYRVVSHILHLILKGHVCACGQESLQPILKFLYLFICSVLILTISVSELLRISGEQNKIFLKADCILKQRSNSDSKKSQSIQLSSRTKIQVGKMQLSQFEIRHSTGDCTVEIIQGL